MSAGPLRLRVGEADLNLFKMERHALVPSWYPRETTLGLVLFQKGKEICPHNKPLRVAAGPPHTPCTFMTSLEEEGGIFWGAVSASGTCPFCVLEPVVSWNCQVSSVGPAAAKSYIPSPFWERLAFALDYGYVQAPL